MQKASLFRLSVDSENSPSAFEITFELEDVLYRYSFEATKEKGISLQFVEVLNRNDEIIQSPRCLLAYKRAKRNHNRFDHSNPALEESSTTVFKLVKELLLHTNAFETKDFK